MMKYTTTEFVAIKNAIREAILDGDIANNFKDAYAFMLEKGKELELEAKKIFTDKPQDS